MDSTQGKLSAGLPKIIDRMRKFHELYERNEAAVRTQIIEPILGLLGYDIVNPDWCGPP